MKLDVFTLWWGKVNLKQPKEREKADTGDGLDTGVWYKVLTSS